MAADEERWMREALVEAGRAVAGGDVPVGALLLDRDGVEIARGHNRREAEGDPTAHAEIEALRAAARGGHSWRRAGAVMVVTLEPCVMCAGALVNARVARLVYGARDEKAGAIDSLFVLGRDPRLNHRFEVLGGVLADDCSRQLRAFFAARR
jgi:tRNA(adenine34) deaminase